MINISDALLISHNFSRAIASVDANGEAFAPEVKTIIGDSAFKRSLGFGDMEWTDKVSLAFDPVGADSFRLRLSWQVSLRSRKSHGVTAYIFSIREVGSTQDDFAKALAILRSDVEQQHLVFVKGMVGIISGHDPVVIK